MMPSDNNAGYQFAPGDSWSYSTVGDGAGADYGPTLLLDDAASSSSSVYSALSSSTWQNFSSSWIPTISSSSSSGNSSSWDVDDGGGNGTFGAGGGRGDSCAALGSGVSIGFEVTTYVMYCSVFVLALCGNGIVCYIVCGSPRMRSVTNYFIVNLAIGDMLMASLCVPFSFVSTLILRYWPFGGALCKVINYSQAVSVFVSSYTLVAISIDRYVAIIYPLRPRMTYLQAKVIIACVWLVALLTALPIPIVSRLDQPDDAYARCGVYICTEIWPGQDGPAGWRLDGETQKYYYSMALMVFQYLIPLSALLVTYARIALVVWGGRPPSTELQGDARAQRMARSKKKVIKMMLMVVIVYTLCWIPQHTLTIVGDVHDSVWMYEHIAYVWFACHWLAMSHTCYNPVIYCWMNAKFRAGFRAVFVNAPALGRCARRCCPPPSSSRGGGGAAASVLYHSAYNSGRRYCGAGEMTAMTTRLSNTAGGSTRTANTTVTSYAMVRQYSSTAAQRNGIVNNTNNNNSRPSSLSMVVDDEHSFVVRGGIDDHGNADEAGSSSRRRLLGAADALLLPSPSSAPNVITHGRRMRNESTSSTVSSSVRIPPYRPEQRCGGAPDGGPNHPKTTSTRMAAVDADAIVTDEEDVVVDCSLLHQGHSRV